LAEVLGYLNRRSKIIELGCSAGDISGWFSDNTVVNVDVVPAAVSGS
jgi:hypothetical protein